MESFESGFLISNVHSLTEDTVDTNANCDMKIKEECDFNEKVDDEFACDDLPLSIKSESTSICFENEDTLSVPEPQLEIEYSDISVDYCGLPNLEMFKELLAYVEDEIEPMHGSTKFAQLFSVLTKLHTNQESVYLNKYIFPSTFVQIIELLYKKLKVLCKISTQNELPDFFMPAFASNVEIVIVGAISLHTSDNSNLIKYLIGYSVFGEVFFVSNSFLGFTPIDELIQYSGILEELEPEQWILYFKNNLLHATQVKYITSKVLGSKLKDTKIEQYVTLVNNKLKKHFQILSQPALDSMLYSKGDICFLDKLIFVCCMLLNMLPRSTYH